MEAVRESGLLISNLKMTIDSIGKGSYAEVFKVRIKGKLYAAKRAHSIFSAKDIPAEEKESMAERFEKECLRVLYLKHPNIVDMVGVHFEKGPKLPILVMELMDSSLTEFLTNNKETDVTPVTKHGLLHDVANGLVYLHGMPPPLGPIVHRDLTANNILLAGTTTSGKMIAKISDLGQAKNNPTYATRVKPASMVPGNEAHMAPETWLDNPDHSPSLDIFSFGVVMLHTLTHEWPTPLARLKSLTVVHTEIERRQHQLEKVSGSQLEPLISQCLSQWLEHRPTTIQVYNCLDQLLTNPG